MKPMLAPLRTSTATRSLRAHPFSRVAALLEGIDPPTSLKPLNFTIGEPTSLPPAWTAAALTDDVRLFRNYPPNGGPDWFNEAVIKWMERRFGLRPGLLLPSMLAPTAGAREALFQLAFTVEGPRAGRDLIAMPTPHYAPYRAAAVFLGFKALPLAADASNGYLPMLQTLPDDIASSIAIAFVCSPSNPEGAVADASQLRGSIDHARKHGYLLVVDECYSEIYRTDRPTSALRVAADMDNSPLDDPFRNLVVVNSLSKRSSAAGLRVGWVAGDKRIIANLIDGRAYFGGSTSLPSLRAAARLYSDERHVEVIRDGYRAAFETADLVLQDVDGYHSPTAGMFLWHAVRDGETTTRRAWQEAGVRVVPGEYLGTVGRDGRHPGLTHVRIAMVHPRQVIEAALARLRPILIEDGVA